MGVQAHDVARRLRSRADATLEQIRWGRKAQSAQSDAELDRLAADCIEAGRNTDTSSNDARVVAALEETFREYERRFGKGGDGKWARKWAESRLAYLKLTDTIEFETIVRLLDERDRLAARLSSTTRAFAEHRAVSVDPDPRGL